MIRVVFFGTSEFAIPILQTLSALKDVKIVGVVTNPDKIAGKKNELTSSPVKLFAMKLDIPVFQPEKLSEESFIQAYDGLSTDVSVLAAYGKIIPENLLHISKKGILNVHPSLLPLLRGATPIQSAILEGHSKTGVSLIVMDKEVDHGPVVAQEVISLKNDETYLTLEPKLSHLGAAMIGKILPDYIADKIIPKEQNHSKATLCKKIIKQDGRLYWQKPANELERQIRAFVLWPGSFTYYARNGQEEMLKITKADVVQWKSSEAVGKIVQLPSEDVLIVCGENTALQLQKVHPAGGTVMGIDAFIRGRQEFIGQILK